MRLELPSVQKVIIGDDSHKFKEHVDMALPKLRYHYLTKFNTYCGIQGVPDPSNLGSLDLPTLDRSMGSMKLQI